MNGDRRIISIRHLHAFLGSESDPDPPKAVRAIICGPEPWRDIAGGYIRLGCDETLLGVRINFFDNFKLSQFVERFLC